MLTISEQATTQPAGVPPTRASTISHDSANRVITVEVTVAQPLGTGAVTIYAPPVTVPSGAWTVNWDLVVTTSGLAAQFAPSGILLVPDRALPPGVTIVTPPAAVSPQRWTLQLLNAVTVANAFLYRIGVTSQLGTNKSTRATSYHDPTIAVVKDPAGPPPSPVV